MLRIAMLLMLAWGQLCAAQQVPCPVRILSIQAAKAAPDGSRPPATQWQSVKLPDAWPKRWPGYSGSVWYRIDWQRTCSSGQAEPVALMLESVTMAGQAFINDQLIWQDPHLTEPLSRSWNMPRYWRLPDALLHDGVNTLWVRVTGIAQQPSGLGPVHIGDPEALRVLYENRVFYNRTLFLANVMVSCLMCILFFFAWLAYRRQTDYGWYALMNLFWALFATNILATTPWPFPDTVMAARANLMLLVVYIACFCMFSWRFRGQWLPSMERKLWGSVAILMLLLAFTPQRHLAGVLLFGTLVSVGVFYLNCLMFPWYALRSRRRDHIMLAACMVIFLVASVHDYLYLLGVLTSGYTWSPATSVVAMMGMSGVLGMRMANDAHRIERFNHELTSRIEQARGELATTLEREHALTLDNARLQERLQIAHDLHDGFGGSLVGMIAMVERANQPLDNQQFISLLKVIRNDLRQTIDAGSSAGVKVPATPIEWIAPLRYRFVQLFDEMGIQSEWRFPRQWHSSPDATQCLALTRFVEEALANILKHSRAQHVLLQMTQTEAGRLDLHIEDDGVGFDVSAVQAAGISVGMRSMDARIARAGGALKIMSRPGLTTLCASLPLQTGPN